MSAYAIAFNAPPSARPAGALTMAAPAPAHPGAGAGSISLVNLAARQRMLSQRMILQAVLAAAGSVSHLEAARKSLQLFGDSQLRLVATANEVDEVSSRSIRDTYTGPRGVGPLIENFMQHMRTTLQCIAQGREFAVVANVLSRITNEIDGLSREAIKLAERSRQAA